MYDDLRLAEFHVVVGSVFNVMIRVGVHGVMWYTMWEYIGLGRSLIR